MKKDLNNIYNISQSINHTLLLQELSKLEFMEVVNLYIESKTGNYKATNEIPVMIEDNLEEFDAWINMYFAGHTVKKIISEIEEEFG
ncbi:hypothetical protein BH23BAC1_BH23BAC1_45530 [soil metagenome]